MSVSAKDLAKKLNISAATVSMVLNNKPGISQATRDKVLTAAHKYGFDFSKIDSKSKTEILNFVIYKKHGVIVTDTPFFSQLLEGIEQSCKDNNFILQITYFNESDSIKEQIDNIKKSDSDGILLLGTEMDLNDFQYFKDISVPIVVLDTYYDELDFDFITINNTRGISEAVNYLIAKGITKIGYLRSSYEITNFSERFLAYCKTLKKYNIEIPCDLIHRLTPSPDLAYNDMKKILISNYAQAYIADNDLIAFGAMRALKELNIKIPNDISVIGFDNMPLCDIIEPPLSTLDVPKNDLGAVAVNQLITRIKNKNLPYIRIQISPTLHTRNSTI